MSHNLAGIPHGISGPALLAPMRAQAERYGATILAGEVETAKKSRQLRSKTSASLPLAYRNAIHHSGDFGVIDTEPDLPNLRQAVQRGVVRHCHICYGYEVRVQNVAVIQTSQLHWPMAASFTHSACSAEHAISVSFYLS